MITNHCPPYTSESVGIHMFTCLQFVCSLAGVWCCYWQFDVTFVWVIHESLPTSCWWRSYLLGSDSVNKSGPTLAIALLQWNVWHRRCSLTCEPNLGTHPCIVYQSISPVWWHFCLEGASVGKPTRGSTLSTYTPQFKGQPRVRLKIQLKVAVRLDKHSVVIIVCLKTEFLFIIVSTMYWLKFMTSPKVTGPMLMRRGLIREDLWLRVK